MSSEAKWEANKKKVAFMRRFPGLITRWDQIDQKTVEKVLSVPYKDGMAALIFSDGRFAVVSPVDPEPLEIAAGLTVIRPFLESKYLEAYKEYDQLVIDDQKALRMARLEKIIGAVQNNLNDIPELKDRLRELVAGWNSAKR